MIVTKQAANEAATVEPVQDNCKLIKFYNDSKWANIHPN